MKLRSEQKGVDVDDTMLKKKMRTKKGCGVSGASIVGFEGAAAMEQKDVEVDDLMLKKKMSLSSTADDSEKMEMPCDSPVAFEDAVSLYLLRRDEACKSDEDQIKRLWSMVWDLKKMDTAWRVAINDQPSATEQILYMLILGHVCSDIFLFNRENDIIQPYLHEDGFERIVKEVKSRGSASGVTMNFSSETKDETIPEDYWKTNDRLMSQWINLEPIIDALQGARYLFSDLTEVSLPAKFEPGLSTEIDTGSGPSDLERAKELKELYYMKDGEKAREKILNDILLGLSEGRRKRSYAPPEANELACYREIRMWVTSTVNFLQAKECWLQAWEDNRNYYLGSGATCGNHFSVERVRKCSGDWKFMIRAGYTSEVRFQAPVGHKTAVVFDELPEFLNLLTLWKTRFHGIVSMMRVSTHVPICIDSVGSGVDGQKRAREQKDQQARKKREIGFCGFQNAEVPARACNSTTGNEGPSERESRHKYLMDILSAFSGNKDFPFSQTWPYPREGRLYAKVLEHIRSSIWLFHKRASCEEVHQYQRIKGAPSIVSAGKYNVTPEMLKERIPFHRLEEIVLLVEKIEGDFWLSPPNTEEVLLYEKIMGHMNVDLMDWRCYQKQKVEGNMSGAAGQQHDLEAAARSTVKAVWHRQKQIAEGLGKEFVRAVWPLFTEAPKSAEFTEWLRMNKHAAESGLIEQLRQSGRGHEFLDSLLLSMHELDELYDSLVGKLTDVNESLFALLESERRFEVPLMEGWTALQVLEASKNIKVAL